MSSPKQPIYYQIRIKGHLDKSWTDWFDGLSLTVESFVNEPVNTVMTGPIADQAALFGILNRIRDLGLPLLSLNIVEKG